MLTRIARGLKQRLTPGTYRGARAGLMPVDLTLSLLAKRSYLMYRVWQGYSARTDPLFDGQLDRNSNFEPDLLNELQRTGFVQIARAFDENEVAQARKFVLELYENARSQVDQRDPKRTEIFVRWEEGPIGIEHDRRSGRTRFFFRDVERQRKLYPDLVAKFVDIPECHALAQAYFDTLNIVPNLPYLMAEVLEPAESIEPWHIDCIRPTLKSFLYLTDVGADQGPLRYLSGTHHVDEERHRLFYRICNGGLGHAYFESAENRRLDSIGQMVTAPANTLIVFDNRGLHSGSFCRSGLRIALVNGYRPMRTLRLNPRLFRDPSPVQYPWERERQAP